MLTQIRLTILSENRVASPNLLAEQGLAIHIGTNRGDILFDTGQTDACVKNAAHLGINWDDLKAVFLSHGHYDHSGGLPAVLSRFRSIDVYCHPALIHKRYRIYPEGRKDIGVPWDKKEMDAKGARFIYKTHATELLPDIWISGEIPRHTDYEQIDESYQLRVAESFIHDEIHDDMTLTMNTVQGLVIILGCGHAGPINSIRHAMRVTGRNEIHAVIGGMHLQHATDEKIEKIVNSLQSLNPHLLVPLHCTGFKAINLMITRFKDRVLLFNVGDRLDLP
jgi:7,8-dihydropterin-6-yl-methyl-4-(beta-D-ribofuranosyl)aminobenzene 5'-phosphate synthase